MMGKNSCPAKPGATALLVIDVQNYFFQRRSGAFLAQSPRILPTINRLIGTACGLGWPVIYTVHRAPRDKSNLMAQRWKRLPSGAGSELFPKLRWCAGATVITKEHYSAFEGTDLAQLLRKRRIARVIICGVMTHLCVDTTARHGFMLGFQPLIVSDACCAKDRRYHSAALRCLRHGFASIVTVRQLDRWAKERCAT